MEAEQKKLLYEWVQQVRMLYPHKQVTNPYVMQLSKLGDRLNLTENELLKETIRCVTLLNQYSRHQSGRTVQSSREDVANGMQLFLRVVCGFTALSMQLYIELSEAYPKELFTYQDVCLELNCGYSTAKRKLAPLLTLGFIEREEAKQFSKMLMRMNRSIFTIIHESPETTEIYNEAFEEWKDYKGFTELQYRT